MFLADMGVSGTTVQGLRDRGEDAIHLREIGLQRLTDDQILLKRRAENRIVLTFDLDFGDLLAASAGNTPSVILFRMRNQTPAAVTPRLIEVLERCADELSAGAFIVIEDGRYRLRRLPIQTE
jgi:predicted nuclease of predicted toxin-antitoxin system